MIILFVAIAANPSWVIFIGFGLYAFSGLIITLLAVHKVRKQRKYIEKS